MDASWPPGAGSVPTCPHLSGSLENGEWTLGADDEPWAGLPITPLRRPAIPIALRVASTLSPWLKVPGVALLPIDIQGWAYLLFICGDQKLRIYTRGECPKPAGELDIPSGVAGRYARHNVFSNGQILLIFEASNAVGGWDGGNISAVRLKYDQKEGFRWINTIKSCAQGPSPLFVTPALQDTFIDLDPLHVPVVGDDMSIKPGSSKTCTVSQLVCCDDINAGIYVKREERIPVKQPLFFHSNLSYLSAHYCKDSQQQGYLVGIFEENDQAHSQVNQEGVLSMTRRTPRYKAVFVWRECDTGFEQDPVFQILKPASMQVAYHCGTVYAYKTLQVQEEGYLTTETWFERLFVA